MNRILGMVSAVLFALLLLACGYLYQERGRLDTLLLQSIQTNEAAAIQLEGAINDIRKNMQKELANPAAHAFRPIYSNYETVDLRIDSLMRSIATFQYELYYSDLSKNTIHQYLLDLDEAILKHEATTISMYDSLLHTYGKKLFHFGADDILKRIEKNQLTWQFQGFHNLTESAERLDKTEIRLLLSTLATKIKVIELLIVGELRGLVFRREIGWWNSIRVHPKQCQVKLGETFEAEIGIAEYARERPKAVWSLTVDNMLLKSEKYDIPVYKKKATHLGWQEFTVVYKTQNFLTGEPIKDEFTYRYEVVR